MRSFNTFHFKGQRDGEEVLQILRRHWFDIFLQLFWAFLILAFLTFISTALPSLFPAISKAPYKNLFTFLENLFLLLIWIISFVIWVDYYFDVWIVTNKRVVNIEQKGLFSRNVSELELEKIQDITTEVHGLIPTFLNYGDVFIQTAGERERFLFRKIPNPYKVKNILMNLQEKKEREETDELGEMIKKKINN
ncbi:MAG: hypothetical protein COU40_01350 [Candidatus Moranbacteria bacterium CG10_big_fil_rev_8_21_14_0_10_35_21]|nr:MAG: hypothetical protein COU40_01350 [Candidatus Moranbacteria bacterium CG10_big_fil_rev_8_21_14_0_10_35_21]PJA88980.1 MAG: hypothetical protein CO139_00175 [Candidatus Moranbacteria bacterium CG_4_9_14_3_um_filter_36_9]